MFVVWWLRFIYDTLRGASPIDRGARYMVYLGARGGFHAMLHRT